MAEQNTKATEKSNFFKKIINWKIWAVISTSILMLAAISKISGYSIRNLIEVQSIDQPISVTIKVRDLQGNRPLKNEGNLVVDYGNGTQTLNIDEEGKVDLRAIPTELKGNAISILLESTRNYIVAPNDVPYILDGEPIEFIVKLNEKLGIIKGKTRSKNGKKNLEGVRIEVDGEITFSDSLGNFNLLLPDEKWQKKYKIFAQYGKYMKEEYYYPNTNSEEFEIRFP